MSNRRGARRQLKSWTTMDHSNKIRCANASCAGFRVKCRPCTCRRGARRRPTILDEYGEVRWPAAADSAAAAAAAEAGEPPGGGSGGQPSPNGDAGRDAGLCLYIKDPPCHFL